MAKQNVDVCLGLAVDQGYLSKADADDIKKSYTKQRKADKTASDESIMQRAVLEKQYEKARQKQLALLSAKKRDELLLKIMSHPEGPQEGLASLLTKNITKGAGYSNIEYRAQAIDGLARRELTEAFDNLREKWGTFWWQNDKELANKVMREIFGEETGDADAKMFAQQWVDTAESLRQQFNAAGGDIPKMSGWGIPQSHNQFKVGRAGGKTGEEAKAIWKNDIMGSLDTEKMGVYSDEDLDALLDYVFDSISTGGLNKMEPGKLPKGISSSLAKSGQQHRVLHFKNADAYIEYAKKYGNDDLYSVMSDHIRGTSNDIATLEIMGPNPQNMFDFLKDTVRKEQGTIKGFDGALDAMFNVATGKVDSMYNQGKANVASARILGAFRSLNVAGKLGSAVVSSITDLAGIVMTARYNDLPVMKVIGGAFKNMAKQDRMKIGGKIGHTMEAWNGVVASRFSEAGDVNSFADKAADKVLRASGLSLWTEAFRKSFAMEFSSFLADNFGKRMDRLPANMREQLRRYGISADDWELIRKSQTYEDSGVKYLDPEGVLNLEGVDKARARDLTLKVQEMIKSETDMAVIQPDARVRKITTWGAQKGELKGEIARTGTQFKSFPMAVIMTHLRRGLAQEGLGKVAYLGSYFTMATVLGAFAVQAKEMMKGREPLDMNTGKFLGASVTQGGGLGIFGDFIFQPQQRFGNSIAATLMGPLGSLAEDVIQKPLGALQAGVDPEKDIGWAGLGRTAIGYIPGNNLWYTRLLFEKVVTDNVMRQLDPKFDRKLRLREMKRKKEWGNGNWYN